MPTGAKNSLGAIFAVETATAGTFIPIEEITDIPGILGDKAGKIDVTNMDSAGYKEYIGDLKDAPEVTIKANWTGATGQARIQTLSDGTNTKFKLTLPDKKTTNGTGTVVARNGYISSFNIEQGIGKQLMLVFTVQFSGAPTITAAS